MDGSQVWDVSRTHSRTRGYEGYEGGFRRLGVPFKLEQPERGTVLASALLSSGSNKAKIYQD